MNILDEVKIREELAEEYKNLRICIYDCIDSTNNEAKRVWKECRQVPCLILAKEQTAGRGRRGRSFYSPRGTGLYMSLLLQPEDGLEDAVHVTTATAVVVAKVLRDLTGEQIGIKWVNDLYLRDKKVCGILTEAIVEPDVKETPAIVVGIGVNLCTENFPRELEGIAGDLGKAGASVDMNELVARIANGLLDYAKDMQDCSFVKDYRQMSVVLGKEIRYNEGDVQVSARALDIDSEGGLMVELADGSVKVLKTGEITVRLAESV